MTAHPLISVSGIPGSGKSTLLDTLSRETGWKVLQFDDFDGLTQWPADQVEAWVRAGMPPEQAFSPAFREAVLQAVATGPLLIETPFGPLHRDEGLPITRSIWLRCDPDIALARAVLKELNSDDWQSVQEVRDWAAGYLTAYPAFVSHALRHLVQTVAPLCDLELNARKSPERLAAIVRATVLQGV